MNNETDDIVLQNKVSTYAEIDEHIV
jgi:hypothetical protein